METSIWNDPSTDGARVMVPEAGAWALSPDDQWLAFADVMPDEAGQCALRCVEVETGRVVFEKRGGAVKALGWASPEQLLVVREQTKVQSRAVMFAVPDGGVLGALALDSLPGSRCKVELAAGAPVALVAPVRWHPLSREREPSRRLAYVLRTDPLEVIASYDPDETSALPRVAEVRAAIVTLSPDGHRLIVWQGAPSSSGVLGLEPGAVLSHDWTRRRDTRVAVAGHAVEEALWMGPSTLALRTAQGGELAHRGDLDVVDLARGDLLYSSVGEDVPDGWMGGRATVDVHPDRARLLVTGRLPSRGRGVRLSYDGVLREVSPAAASASPLRRITSKVEVAMGGAWLPQGGLAVFRARTQREGEVVRLRTIDGEPEGAAVTVPLDGRKPTAGRLTRSPGATMLVASWRVEPEGPAHAKRRLGSSATRHLYGPVYATRVALVPLR